MLRDKANDAEDDRLIWSGRKLLITALAGTFLAALLGALVWLVLVLGSTSDQSGLGTAITFGAAFGGWVGLGASALFGLIRRVREYGLRSPPRMALTFAVLGGTAASPLFVPFADGWGMAIGGLVESAIIGGLIGAVLGTFLFFTMFRRGSGLFKL